MNKQPYYEAKIDIDAYLINFRAQQLKAKSEEIQGVSIEEENSNEFRISFQQRIPIVD